MIIIDDKIKTENKITGTIDRAESAT